MEKPLKTHILTWNLWDKLQSQGYALIFFEMYEFCFMLMALELPLSNILNIGSLDVVHSHVFWAWLSAMNQNVDMSCAKLAFEESFIQICNATILRFGNKVDVGYWWHLSAVDEFTLPHNLLVADRGLKWLLK